MSGSGASSEDHTKSLPRERELELELRLRCAELDAALARAQYLRSEAERLEDRVLAAESRARAAEADLAETKARYDAVTRSSSYLVARRFAESLHRMPGVRVVIERASRFVRRSP
jgi:hypothetical protein